MTNSRSTRDSVRCAATVAVAAALALACTPKLAPSLAGLCAATPATAHVSATIDSVRPTAGAALVAAKGSHFEMTFEFPAGATVTSGDAANCTGAHGTAAFSGTLPDRIRLATASSGQATWRIEGDTVLLDLNPGTRDNNVFVVLPLDGSKGHWGLSTFAGEVAGGNTTAIR